MDVIRLSPENSNYFLYNTSVKSQKQGRDTQAALDDRPMITAVVGLDKANSFEQLGAYDDWPDRQIVFPVGESKILTFCWRFCVSGQGCKSSVSDSLYPDDIRWFSPCPASLSPSIGKHQTTSIVQAWEDSQLERVSGKRPVLFADRIGLLIHFLHVKDDESGFLYENIIYRRLSGNEFHHSSHGLHINKIVSCITKIGNSIHFLQP